MNWLQHWDINLASESIHTERCILVPFSLDVWVDMEELTREFCKANKDLFISPFLPTVTEEIEYIQNAANAIIQNEVFENFILDKQTHSLIGSIGLRTPEEHRMNIGLWIRESEHWKWYATETYAALIEWSQRNTRYKYLKHSLDPRNVASRKLALKFGGVLQDETNEKWDEIYHIPLK